MIYEYWLAGIKEITDLKKQKLREVYVRRHRSRNILER